MLKLRKGHFLRKWTTMSSCMTLDVEYYYRSFKNKETSNGINWLVNICCCFFYFQNRVRHLLANQTDSAIWREVYVIATLDIPVYIVEVCGFCAKIFNMDLPLSVRIAVVIFVISRNCFISAKRLQVKDNVKL
jgi:hypothetical protein